MTEKDIFIKLRHLFMRSGFGAGLVDLEHLSAMGVKSAVDLILKNSSDIESLNVATENTMEKMVNDKSPEEKKLMQKELRKESKEKIKQLNILWINKMAEGRQALREKMTLFWHGHFACQNSNAFYVQNQNNIIRKYALGKFGDLLMAVSKDPAMLSFLNNRQNKKGNPNENFAREVMELFTLGRGNYSEHDIKNAARAFTGWNFKPDGNFYINNRQHDEGEKTFMGKTGNFGGEEILKIILDNKQTAFFITSKIYSYFVNENPDNKIIKSLADKFYQSGYDIKKLMEEIFKSNWFYNEENIGKRIKNPIELLVGLKNTFGLNFENEQSILFIQKALGLVLFYPPNVAGWKEGRNWIDSSSLMFRLRLPDLLFKSAEINIQVKHDGDVNTDYLAKGAGKNLKVSVDWENFVKPFIKYTNNEIPDQLINYLLSYKLSKAQKDILIGKADNSAKENFIKSVAIAITGLPEYQMC